MCNLQTRKSNKIPILFRNFHNFWRNDGHIFTLAFEVFQQEISIIDQGLQK